MRLPKDCSISLGTVEGKGTDKPTVVMTGGFTVTTKTDCDLMIAAMEAIGATLADRAPRKKKSRPTAVKAA